MFHAKPLIRSMTGRTSGESWYHQNMGMAEDSTCIVARESLKASAAADARARMSVAREASYLSARHASSPGTATSPRPARHAMLEIGAQHILTAHEDSQATTLQGLQKNTIL